jgi:hypothetical protein
VNALPALRDDHGAAPAPRAAPRIPAWVADAAKRILAALDAGDATRARAEAASLAAAPVAAKAIAVA